MITERSRRLLATTAIVGMAALSAGCGADRDGGGSAVDAIRVGLLFPTSGAFASLGQDQNDGAKMVLDWVNANGGVGGVRWRSTRPTARATRAWGPPSRSG